MTGVLIDTSAWIDALRKNGDPGVRAAVRNVTAEGSAVWCDMVRLELWNGARGAAEKRMLRELEKELPSVPITSAVWQAAIDLARSCRRKGITIPATDLVIAACAECHGLSLLHHDPHFQQIGAAQTRQESKPA